ncbi:MAG: type II toxin-antitoxin system HicB family antitoxin [Dongiaceae bacterium]
MDSIILAYPATLTRDEAGRYVVRFRDLPEALTDGKDEQEALAEATDCLSEALMSRIADREDIPVPSRARRGDYSVAPDPTIALKTLLFAIVKASKISTSELARRLGVDHKEARRMLDPSHPTKFPRLQEALKSLGHEVRIAWHDASRQERLLRSPKEKRRGTLRPKQFIGVSRG